MAWYFVKHRIHLQLLRKFNSLEIEFWKIYVPVTVSVITTLFQRTWFCSTGGQDIVNDERKSVVACLRYYPSILPDGPKKIT